MINKILNLQNFGIFFTLCLTAAIISFSFLSPVISYAFTFVTIYFSSTYRLDRHLVNKIIYTIVATFTITISIFAAYGPTFRYYENDFNVYYANYLNILNSTAFIDLDSIFEFGGGFEVGLPIINLIFSLVIGQPYAYLLKFSHVMLICLMLTLLYIKISRINKLQYYNIPIMLFFLFFFVKYDYLFNHLRQAYADIFVLYALYAIDKRIRLLLILIASAFHISAFFVYFLTAFIFLRFNLSKRLIYLLGLIFLLLTFQYLMLDFTEFMRSNPILIKFDWFFYNETFNTHYLTETAKAIAPLIVALMLIFVSKCCEGLIYLKQILRILLLCVCLLPFNGLALRVMEPVIMVLPGFYVYYAYSFSRVIIKKIILFILLPVIMLLRFNNPMFLYEVNSEPFFSTLYFEKLFTYVNYLDRSALPLFVNFQSSI